MIYVDDTCDVDRMTTMFERLKQARSDAGFKSARAAAIRFGWGPSTYAAHENGQNRFGPEAAKLCDNSAR